MESQIKNGGRGAGMIRRYDPDDLKNKYNKWTDSEFIEACKLLNFIQPLSKQIEFVHYHSKRFGLFGLIERIIDGNIYKYGIDVCSADIAQAVGVHYVSNTYFLNLNSLQEEFLFRLNKCISNAEKLELIEAELDYINKRWILESGKQSPFSAGFVYGYETEIRKQIRRYEWAYLKGDEYFAIAKGLPIWLEYCTGTASGAAFYLFKKKINEMKYAQTSNATKGRQMGMNELLKCFAVRNYDGYKSAYTLERIEARFSMDFKEWATTNFKEWLKETQNETNLNEDSKLSEWESFFEYRKLILEDFEKILSKSLDKKGLKLNWIAELEKAFCIGENGIKLKNNEKRSSYVPFWDVTFGFDYPLKHYAYLIYEGDEDSSPNIGVFVSIMAAGFAYAHILAELRKLDISENNSPVTKIVETPQKKIFEQKDIEFEEFELELVKIRGVKNEFWKGLPMDIAVDHFLVLTNRKSKNGESFLTKRQFISFLKRAFVKDDTQPTQKINCQSSQKGFVILRFFEFFSIAVSKYSHPNKKADFIYMFEDCFDNWEKGTIKAFFKLGKTKEKW